MGNATQPFRFHRKWRDEGGRTRFEYEASFWEGRVEPSQSGRYARVKCRDVLIEDSEGVRRPLNTSPSVSYYSDLMRALR